MSFTLHLWQGFLTLHPWGYVTTAVLLLIAFIKRKAIAAASASASNAVKKRFFGWVSDNLPHQKSGTERTYRGIFVGYAQYENPPNEWFFTLVENGVTHKVSVWASNLLSGVQHGAFVEIETERIADRSTRHTILHVKEIEKTR